MNPSSNKTSHLYYAKVNDGKNKETLLELNVTEETHWQGEPEDKIAFLKQVIHKILNDDMACIQQGERILINLKDNTYQIGKKNISLDELEKISPVEENAIKITDVADRVLTKRDKDFHEIWDELWNEIVGSVSEEINIVDLLWCIVIFPIACVNFVFNPGQIYDAQSMQIAENPRNRLALESSLQEVLELFENNADATSQQISMQLKDGITLAQAWRADDADKKQIATDLAQKMLTIETKVGKTTPLAIIPGGYWNQSDEFEPVMYSFYRDERNSLCVSILRYGTEIRTVSFGNQNPEFQNKITALVFHLLSMTDDPIPLSEITKEEKDKVEFLNALLSGPGKAKNESATKTSTTSPEHLIEGYCQAAGGRFIPAPSKTKQPVNSIHPIKIVQDTVSIPKPKQDPAKLLFQVLQTQFPEADLRDKLLFSLNLFYRRMGQFIEVEKDMKTSQKLHYLQKLEKDANSLERQIRKMSGQEDPTHLFMMFNQRIEALNQLKRTISAAHDIELANRLNKLDRAPTGKPSLSINLQDTLRTGSSQHSVNPVQQLTAQDRSDIADLKIAFSPENGKYDPANAIKILQKLTTRVDALMNSQDFEVAMELFRAIMVHIPTPSDTKEVKYFGLVRETGFWAELRNIGDTALVHDLNAELGKLGQCFWEAKLKTGGNLMSSEEWVDMMHIEATIHQLIRVEQKILLFRCGAIKSSFGGMFENESEYKELSDQQKALLQPEQLDFLAVASDRNHPGSYVLSIICSLNEENHLRLCEHPLVLAKYQKIQPYLSLRYKDEFNACGSRVRYELHQCESLLNARGNKNPSKDEIRELHSRYYSRTIPGGNKPNMPQPFVTLSRHQLMLVSLLHPSAISRPANRSWACMKQLFGDIDEEEFSRKIRREALEIIPKQGRFEIGITEDYDDHENNEMHGISLRGTEDFILDISSDDRRANQYGNRGYQQNENMYVEALNHPVMKKTDRNAAGKGEFDASAYYGAMINPIGLDAYSDATLLSQSLTSGHSSPLTNYLLYGMKVLSPKDSQDQDKWRALTCSHLSNDGKTRWFSYGDATFDVSYTHQSLHEVFDTILHDPSILHRLEKNGEGVDGYEVHKRLYEVLFLPGLIEAALEKSPEFFLSHAQAIKTLMDHFIKTNNGTAFTFLLYLSDGVYQHIKQAYDLAEPSIYKKKLAQILEEWPHRDSFMTQDIPSKKLVKLPTYADKAFEFYQRPPSNDKQLNLGSYLLNMYAKDIRAWDLQNPSGACDHSLERVATLLQIGSVLEVAKGTVNIPVIAEDGLSWLKDHLVPFIETLDPQVMNALLDPWIGLDVNLGKPWVRAEGQPSVYTQAGTKGDTIVDLKSLQCLKKEGKALKGREVTLPNDVLKHQTFMNVFGKNGYKSPVKFRVGSIPGELIYDLKDINDVSYRIRVNKRLGTFIIDRFENSPHAGALWFRLCMPQQSEQPAIGLEKRIMEKGIWIDLKNPLIGFALLGNPATNSKRSEKYTIRFNRAGKIESIRTLNSRVQKEMEVVHDVDGSLEKVLSCLPSDQMVFLKKQNEKEVTKILFLDQDLFLERTSPQDEWKMKTLGEKNSQEPTWVMGTDRGDATNNLLHSLGLNIEQTGFTVRENDITTLIIWPQQVTSKNASHMDPSEFLTFTKNPHTTPPLKIKIKNNGEVLTSSGGYLQLAYLFAVRGDYAKASLYIEKARAAKIGPKAELQMILQLNRFLQQLPVFSTKSAAIKLKGLLAAQQILKEQTKSLPFEAQNWKPFLATAQEINDAYAYYQRYSNNDRHHHANFTAAELTELGYASQESLAFALKEKPQALNKLSLPVPEDSEVKFAVPLLVIRAGPPLENFDKEQLVFNEHFVVNHFFDLHRAIVKGDLVIQDLLSLYGRLPPSIDQQSQQLFDVARRMLILAALQKLSTSFDETVIKDLQDKLPDGFLDLGLKWLFSEEKKEEYKDFQKNFDAITRQFHCYVDARFMGPSSFILEKPFSGDEKLVDIKKFKDAIYFDHTLSKAYKELIQTAIRKIPEDKEMHIDEFVEEILKDTGINILEIFREQQVTKRIDQIKNELLTRKAKKVEAPYTVKMNAIDTALFNGFWKPKKPSQQIINRGAAKDNIEAILKKQIDESIVQTCDKGVIQTSRNDLLEGLTKAEDAFLQKKIPQTLSKDNLDAIIKQIAVYKDGASKRMNDSRTQLLDYVKAHRALLPIEVKRALEHQANIGDEGIMYALNKAYQNMELNDPKALDLLTQHFLYKSAFLVLSKKVEDQLNILRSLQETEDVNDPSDEWMSAASKIHQLTTQALDFNRYLNDAGQLQNESLYRKVIALEANQGFIVTAEQIDLILKMVEKPDDWYELKVGAGKTSVVFPIVLLMLIEQGRFPTAVVKSGLFQKNLQDLDLATRELLENAGVEFSFAINDEISPTILQEKYLRLLEVELHRGYSITTIDSIIAVNQKLQLLHAESRDVIKESRPGWEKVFDKIQQEIFYLSAINEKLRFLIVDEADDVLNVIFENNVSQGEASPLQTEIQDAMVDLNRIIRTSVDPEIMELKNALEEGRQAALETSWVKGPLIRALAKEMVKDPLYLKKIGLGPFDAMQVDRLINHLCTILKSDEKANDVSFVDKTESKSHLGALKQILQNSLPTALRQNPGIEVGVKKSDGYQIGPQVSGQEKVGTVFSDECDLIVNHYLYYAERLPEGDFIKNALRDIQSKNPALINEWIQSAKEEELIPYLNKSENSAQRLKFLREYIIRESKIIKKRRQIVFNVQDSCYGRSVGGMTGTRNQDSLPKVKRAEGEQVDHSKKLIAEVLLDISALTIPPITVVDEGSKNILAQMKIDAQNLDNKAIINQGYDLDGKDTQAVVEELRKAAPHRIYVYDDSETRETYIWYPGAKKPERIPKSALNELALNLNFKEKACFYFSPADTRGTDFRIPPGTGAIYLSPSCSMDDFIQSAGRMRGLGEIHKMSFVITKGIETRIRNRHGDKTPIDYGMIVDDINQEDVQVQQGKQLKTAVQGIKTIVSMGTRQMLFGLSVNANGKPIQWAPKDEYERRTNHMITEKISAIADHPSTGWLVDVSHVDLEQQFTPSRMEETEEMASRIFEAEEAKLEKLRKVTSELEMDQRYNQDAFAQARIKGLKIIVQNMQQDLKEHKNYIHEKLADKKRQIYPSGVPSNGAGVPNAQAQVQEQQLNLQQNMQQQQNMSLQQAQGKAGQAGVKYPYVDYQPENLGTLADLILLWDPHGLNLLIKGVPQYLDKFNVKISPNARNIINTAHGTNGNPSLCRLAFKNGQGCLISRQDYHAHGDDPNTWDTIYSFVNNDLYGVGVLLDQQNNQNVNQTLIEKQISQAKFIMGLPLNAKDKEEIKNLTSDLFAKGECRTYVRHFTPSQYEEINSLLDSYLVFGQPGYKY